MANIQTFIQQIKSAIYGRDVRQSICDAIEAIDDEVVAAHEEMSEFVQSEMDDTLTSPTLPAQAKAVGDAIANIRIDLDTTLTHAGEAADAKAVGDAITAATVAIDDTLTETGEAADAKKTGDEISGLKNALNAMDTATESDVGKALKAKTVSGGKVTEWEFGEAGGADPEVIEQAVTDWLDEHPEAVTTVEDGSITFPKLHDDVAEAINDKAPAITGQTELKNTFSSEELAGYNDYTIICDATDAEYIGYAKALDFLPPADAETGTKWSKVLGNSIVVNGSFAGETYYFSKYNGAWSIQSIETISAGDTINFAIFLDGIISGQAEQICAGRRRFQARQTDHPNL